MNLLKLLLLFNLFQDLKPCSNGCLKCLNKDQCLLCDFSNKYYLNGTACQKSDDNFCQSMDLYGNCLQCSPGFYLESKKCTSVGDSQISNCKYYLSPSTCSFCEKNFSLVEGKCEKPELVIENCMVQAGRKCLQCDSDFLLYGDSLCSKRPSTYRCQQFSTQQCRSCKPEHFLEKNYLRNEIQKYAQSKETADKMIIYELFFKSEIHNKDFCKPIDIKNCLTQTDRNFCSECKKGNFLKDGFCIENPKEKINNCFKYSSFSQCSSCSEGYHLDQDFKCQSNTLVENCSIYNSQSFETQCLKCVDSHFLKDKSCDQRQIVVELCLEYQPKSDQCAKCQENLQLTSDSLRCLSSIKNCTQYSESSKFTTELQCKECARFHFLLENLCFEGQLPNCVVYETSNTCRECSNQFFLNEKKQCQEHETIQNCSLYHKEQQNLCVNCQKNFISISQLNVCAQHQIEGCKVPLNETECYACNPRHDLTLDKKCQPLSKESNCLASVQGQCIECEETFELEKEKCEPKIMFKQNLCLDYSWRQKKIQEESHCEKCFANTLPVKMNNSTICMDSNEIGKLMPYQQQNCKVKGLWKSKLICYQCLTGFLNDIYQGCIEGCQNGETLLLEKDELGRSQCTKASDVCLVKGKSLQNQDKYICLLCPVDYVQLSGPKPTEFALDLKQLPKPEVSCELKSKSLIYEDPQNCVYFQKLSNGVLTCSRCEDGFTSDLTYFQIPYCKEYESLQCKECLTGYQLQNQMQCQKIQNEVIANCEENQVFDGKCLKCKDRYFYKGNQCTETAIKNCEVVAFNQDLCLVCSKEFMLSDDQNTCLPQVLNCMASVDGLCKKCQEKFFLKDGKCHQLTQVNCYKEDESGNCEIFTNLQTKQINQCAKNQTVDNCLSYSNKGECIECQEAYYLSEGKCCQKGSYGDNCEKTSNSCSIFRKEIEEWICDECKEQYAKDLYQTEKCVKIGHYILNDVSTDQIQVAFNEVNCDVYDYRTRSCLLCKVDYYLSQGNCCHEGFSSKQNKCIGLEEQGFKSCLQLEDSGNCQKCAQSTELVNGFKCCPSNHYWDQTCKLLPLNCKEFSLDSQSCSKCRENFYSQNDKSCCEEGKFLNLGSCVDISIKHCSKQVYSDCSECQRGFRLVDGVCLEIDSLLNNCLFVDEGFLCSKCKSEYALSSGVCCHFEKEIFSEDFGKCIKNPNYFECVSTQIKLKDKCCNQNESLVENNCLSNILIENCLFWENSLSCKKCKAGSYLPSCCPEHHYYQEGQCLKISIENCLEMKESKCTNCEKNFFLDYNSNCISNSENCLEQISSSNSTSCTRCSFLYSLTISGVCINNILSKLPPICKSAQDISKCDLCHEGYYLTNDFCCKNGQFFDLNLKKCTEITQSHCVKLDEKSVCLECQHRKTLSTSPTITFKDISGTETVVSHLQSTFYLSQNQCCPHGSYFDTSKMSCTTIPIDSCIEYQDAKCLRCQDDFVLYESKLCCSSSQIFENNVCIETGVRICPQDFYLSSQHCCELGYYWEESVKECASILIQNCMQADNISSCRQCSVGFFKLANSGLITFASHYLESDSCVLKQYTENTKTGCEIFNNDICTKCKESMTLNNGQCCKKGYFSRILEDDIVCVNPISLYSNCEHFDNQNQQCCQCEKLHHLSQGLCCPKDYFYSFETHSCSIYNKSCVKMSKKNQTCLQCAANHYLQNNNCIPYSFELNFQNQIQESVNCISKDLEGMCQKCKTGFYLSFHHCCQEGYHWSGNACEFNKPNCISLSDDLSCSECFMGFYLINQNCCEFGKYFDLLENKCIPIQTPNCLVADSTGNCIQCKENGFNFKDNYCCPSNFVYNKVNANCQQISETFLEKCKYYDSYGCAECFENFFPVFEVNLYTCQPIPQSSLVENCQKYSSGFECKLFKEFDYYELLQSYKFSLNPDTPLIFSSAKLTYTTTDCQQRNYLGTCKKCNADSDLLLGGRCYQHDNDFCTIKQEQYCLACRTNYFINQGICQLRDFSFNQCNQYFNYFIDKENKEMTTEVDDKNFPETCIKCQVGFKETPEALCQSNQVKFQNQKCEEKNINFYFAKDIFGNSKCCDLKEVLIGDRCVNVEGRNCQDYEEKYEGNTLVLNCKSCQNGFYMTEQHCCELKSFWNGTECVKDDASNCQMFQDNQGTCKKDGCASGFYSSLGKCCLEKTFWNGSSCADIQIENCLFLDENLKCTQCSSGILRNDCCVENENKYLDESQGICIVGGALNCMHFDGKGTCTQCNSNYYFSSGNCCQMNQYWSSAQNQCITIEIGNCQQQNQLICMKCHDGHILIEGICCKKGEYFSQGKCIPLEAVNSCLNYEVNLQCSQCDSSYSLYSEDFNMCCQNGYYKKGSQCVLISQQNCDSIDNNQNCTKCKNDFHLSQKTCCPVGQYFNGAECIFKLENCMEFTIDAKCSSCQRGYQLATDKSVCCSAETYYDEKAKTCKPLSPIFKNCVTIEQSVCSLCKENYVLDQAICSPEGFYWNGLTFIEIHPEEKNCASIISGKCQKCKTGFYFSNQKCCRVGFFFDVESFECVLLQNNCSQQDGGRCLQCQDLNMINQDQHCCSKDQVFDGLKCIDIENQLFLENCELFDSEENKCQKCKMENLNDEFGFCCSKNQVFANEKCHDQFTVDILCESWDFKAMQCVKCNEKVSYLQQRRCVPYSLYLEEEGTQSPIDASTFLKCDQFDPQNNICVGCQNSKKCPTCSYTEDYLFESNKCIKIENCLTFSSDYKACSQCHQGFYISKGICCNLGSFLEEGICRQIPIKKCDKYDGISCSECSSNHYLSQGYCCPFNHHFNEGSNKCEQGLVENCQKYNDHGKCSKCTNNYFLITNENIEFCQLNPKDFCLTQSLTLENSVSCDKCEKGFYLLDKQEKLSIQLEEIQKGCKQHEIKKNIALSNFACHECDLKQYILNDGKCESHQQIVDHCQEEYIFQDSLEVKCSQCNEGYLLVSGKCREISIYNCEVYDLQSNLCKRCSQGYQLYSYVENSVQQSKCFKDFLELSLNPPKLIVSGGCKYNIDSCSSEQQSSLKPDQIFDYTCQNCTKEMIPVIYQDLNKKVQCVPATQIPVENCSLGSYSTKYLCNSCKPGFKPMFNTGILTTCEKIDNCEVQGSKFDLCQKCSSGHSFRTDNVSGLTDFALCRKTQNQDCLVTDQKDSCILCNDMLSLIEGKCIALKTSNCKIPERNLFNPFKNDMQIQNEVLGCQECEKDFSKVFFKREMKLCAQRDPVSPSTQEVIQNCTNYFLENNQVKCKECSEGLILTAQKTCVQNKVLHCMIALDPTTCRQCSPGFILHENKCFQITIQNCSEITMEENQQICLQCQNEYQLLDGGCQMGQIAGCLKYKNQKCFSCKEGFSLINSTPQRCVMFEEQQNCLEFDEDHLIQGNLHCVKCQNQSHFVQNLIIPDSVCVNYSHIDNCVEYQDEKLRFDMKCTKCSSDFYLDGNQCVKRTLIEKCLSYEFKENSCQECEEGFYLEDKTCRENPNGIKFCESYKDSNTCLQCKTPYYLEQNNCLETENFTESCLVFSKQGCLVCVGGFNLNNLQCVPNSVENCLLEQNGECKACADDFYLDSNECLKIQETQNCHQQSQVAPFSCVVCNEGYFNENDICVTVDQPIANCQFYDEEQKCFQCKENHLLSLNQLSCSPQVNHCLDLRSEQPFCILCQSGYKLTSLDTCVEDVDQSQFEGCFIADQRNPQLCLICEQGYNHSQDGQCTVNEALSISNQESNFIKIGSMGQILLLGLAKILAFQF